MPEEPLPEGGWSRNIKTLSNAIACPAPTLKHAPGIWCDGEDYARAATWRSGMRCTAPIKEAPTAIVRRDGRHLWGGVYFGHFGHFITETVSRLWAYKPGEYESVVFVPRHGDLKDFTGYQKEIIDLFLGEQKFEIVRQPTEYETLTVPGQGFGVGAISVGTPEFREYAKQVMQEVVPDGPEKIYISRTKFSGKGGIIGENFLQRNMERLGYTSVFPEKMSIAKQLSTFKAARKIVGLDSSAFHLLGYVSDPSQEVCIILRRSHDAYRYIVDHVSAFSGKDPIVIDAIMANWMPESQKMANHVSWGELDERALASQLKSNGFIDEHDVWEYMNDDDFSDSLRWSEERHKSPLIRRKLR